MTPQALQKSLFSAILEGDGRTVGELCSRHAEAIVEQFPSWTTVPPAFRADPRAMQAWAHCLMTVAQLFQSAGIPELMDRLTGGADNVFVRWRQAFARATALAGNGDYAQSSELLEALVRELDGAQGDIVDDWRPKAYGLLGTNAFRLGREEEALRLTSRALEECRRVADAAGIRAYTENLRVLAAAQATRSADPRSQRMLRIRASIARAQDLSDDARFDQSNELLEAALAEIEAAGDGPGSEYAGKAHGLLGLNHLRLGDAVRARTCTQQALDCCEARDDADGVRIYAANLAHLDRLARSAPG